MPAKVDCVGEHAKYPYTNFELILKQEYLSSFVTFYFHQFRHKCLFRIQKEVPMPKFLAWIFCWLWLLNLKLKFGSVKRFKRILSSASPINGLIGAGKWQKKELIPLNSEISATHTYQHCPAERQLIEQIRRLLEVNRLHSRIQRPPTGRTRRIWRNSFWLL